MDQSFPNLLKPFLKYAGTAPVTADSSLHELGLDSMRAIELLFAIEDAYGVTMPDELLTDSTFATAGSLWAAIRSLRIAPEPTS
jgi:acyl carrier protein